MAVRSGHGRYQGKGLVVEVLPPDELPHVVPVDVAALPAPPERRQNGTLVGSEAAKTLGAKGGKAKAAKRQALQKVGLLKLADDSKFKPYWDEAQAWLDVEKQVVAMVGGGFIGPGPLAILGFAAMKYAAAKFFFDQFTQTENMNFAQAGQRQSESCRQDLLAAHELAVREGKLRQDGQDPYEAFKKAIGSSDSD